LLRHANLKTLANDYDLVLAPSWSPPHDLSFYLASKFWPGTLFHLISNHSDVVTSKRIYKNSHAIPLLASNWVHPDIFKPRAGIQKEFDIVTLANFSKYKRHFSLFRLLRHMRSDTRVLLLGVPWQDRTAETLKAEASLYGVSHRITIREHLPDNQLLESIQSAKVGFIPSMNEGSCVAVTEMLFLDVPVGLYKAAIVGSKQFIGAGTGIIIGYRDAGELQRFVDEYRSYSPRQIVTQNRISCFDSTVVLNERLKRSATENGTPWTTDICVHHWRPNPTYVSNSDMARFEPEIHDFKKKYGIEIKSPHSIKPIA
jgi:glycosyltransferase involved in cell wall biosynthesis